MRYALLFFFLAIAALTLLWAAGRGASPDPPPVRPRGESATSYYIDAVGGNDEADGRTESSAWKSLGRLLQTYQAPGSAILLRRGGVWRESLIVDASGTAEAPIRVGAYGEGAPPSVRGSDVFGAPGLWRYEGDGIWYLDDIRNDPGVFYYDDKVATPRRDKDSLADPWDFWYDDVSRRLYVRQDSNPAAVAQSIEVPVRDFVAGPLSMSHLRLEGLDFRHAIKTTLLLWEADHVEIADCAFTQSGGTHCQIGQGANYASIAACTFDDWNLARGRGYAIQAVEAGSGPTDVEGCHFNATHRGAGEDHSAIRSDDKAWIRVVRACRFSGGGGNLAGDGVSVWRPSGAASSLLIEDNQFEGLGGRALVLEELENYGGALSVTVQRNRIHGACLRDTAQHDAIAARGFTGTLASVVVACNVITGTFQGRLPHAGIGIQEAGGLQIVHNAVRGVDDGIVVGFGASTSLVANNLLVGNRGVGLRSEAADSSFLNNAYFGNGAGPVAGLTLADGDLTADPMVDGDLRPGATSPCIDRGVETEVVLDFDRNRRPAGDGPDIGAYEISPAVP
ncbi:MAG: right-handed parallel beta-helix repeat-containing protein [Candidatus Hydrogenedentes bacterium]|nr:right-handed parallel beta-helix repeat-containing protein [Candidatus Hydrogenedentota bacterium]